MTCLVSGINSNVIGNGVVANAAFTVSPSAPGSSSVIQIAGGIASTPTGSGIPASGTAGTVTITGTGTSRCDLNSDLLVNVVDLQRLANVILGTPASGTEDLNRDGRIDIVDVQVLINVIQGTMLCPP
jgi:hypothetical protein